jgi:signal transduction histidine kinase/ActR/RegA family two-component response regulator
MDVVQKKEQKNRSKNSLRAKAERIIEVSREASEKSIRNLDIEQITEVIHELKVHQVELEMQNENLLATHAQLEKVNAQYADLYDNAPVGYVTSNAFGVVLRVNKTLAGMLNARVPELLNTNLGPWCQDQDAFYLHCRTMINKDGTHRSEIRMKKADHSVFPVSVESRFVQGDYIEARPEIRSVIIDISEKKQLEENLRRAERLETIGTLAGGIAHEFNNILSIIIGNNELAMEAAPHSGFFKDNLEEIRSASMRAKEVVKQLLTFSRQDNAKKIPLDISTVVKDSIKLIRSSTPANIEIRQRLSDNVDAIVANPTQINQLLINLCSNATDAMPPAGGMITIELLNSYLKKDRDTVHLGLKPGRYIKLMVRDNGFGMQKGIMNRIFEPYFTTKEVGKGTGIGLAVVHGIVERHNGVITVESHPGEGTLFTTYLPSSRMVVEEVPDEQICLPKGDETILIVDDERSILKLWQLQFEKLGYTVVGMTDPLEAVTHLNKDHYSVDLVITDMAMPRMTGDQLAIEILKINPNIPIILCTGYSEKISKEKAFDLGICAFAMKPLNINDFAFRVRNVLDSRRQCTLPEVLSEDL